jgi:hypothetical protein
MGSVQVFVSYQANKRQKGKKKRNIGEKISLQVIYTRSSSLDGAFIGCPTQHCPCWGV